jgi:hypothetical protein
MSLDAVFSEVAQASCSSLGPAAGDKGEGAVLHLGF